MEEKIKSLQYKTKANDVDEKGIVTVAVNGIGVKDSQNDISMPGSFNKTLKENIGRMRWFLNHRTDQLLGVPLSGKETEGNLVMVGMVSSNTYWGQNKKNSIEGKLEFLTKIAVVVYFVLVLVSNFVK